MSDIKYLLSREEWLQKEQYRLQKELSKVNKELTQIRWKIAKEFNLKVNKEKKSDESDSQR